MTITNANIFSRSYTIIKNFINTNVVDPRGRFKKRWVHSAVPDINGKAFDGYPFWTIEIDVSEEDKSFDRSTSNKIFNAIIMIYSKEPTEVDSLADSFFNQAKNETLTDNLNDFKSLELGSSPFTVNQDMNGQKIYSRAIGIIGMERA